MSFFKYLHGTGFHLLIFMPLTFFALVATVVFLNPTFFSYVFWWFVILLPIVSVPGFAIAAALLWRSYVRSHFVFTTEYTVLEVRIPRDSMKSPKAMAVIFNGIITGGRESTFINRWWEGKMRPQYSFELVSIEGMIHFFIHLEKRHVDFVSSHIYGQFPDAEIEEVPDYTSGVPINYDPDKVGVLALEYKKAKPDPYPIKTYVEYGVDQDPSKMEQRIDPLAGVFEFFSSLGPGEEMWLQLVIRRNLPWEFGIGPFKIGYSWHKGAQQQIDNIYASLVEEEIAPGVKSKAKSSLTPSQEEEVRALASTLHAEGIDVGMRLIYIARKESFKPGERAAPGLVKLWREFRTPNLNAIVPYDRKGFIVFDYPWQFEKLRIKKHNEELIDAYKRRSFYRSPYIVKHMIMSPAELATVYHYPSYEIKTPGITRVESKKGGAPANLPTAAPANLPV